MIKVLQVISTPAIWSGVMSVVMNYYRHIDRTQIQFDFLCFTNCKESYEEEIQTLGGTVIWIKKPDDVSSLFAWKNFFEVHGAEYQCLHNHEVYLSFFLKPLASKFGIKKFIVHSHTTEYSDKRIAAMRNKMLCISLRFMHCEKLACSQAAGVFLYGKKALKEGKIYVLPNAIDIKKYRFNLSKRQEMRRQLGLEHCFVIGHVGRFVRQKNHKFLLRVFRDILRQRKQARLVLIGDGIMRESIENECCALKIQDNVLLLGQRNDVEDLLQIMDVLLLPSLYEGFPVVAIEAQANGLSCILASSITQEARLNSNVYFLKLHSADEWAEFIQQKENEFLQLRTGQFDIMPSLKPGGIFDIESQCSILSALYLASYGGDMI